MCKELGCCDIEKNEGLGCIECGNTNIARVENALFEGVRDYIGDEYISHAYTEDGVEFWSSYVDEFGDPLFI